MGFEGVGLNEGYLVLMLNLKVRVDVVSERILIRYAGMRDILQEELVQGTIEYV